MFTVIDESMEYGIRQAIKQQQHQNMKYFVDVSKEGVVTNSSLVVAMLKAEDAVHRIEEESDGFPIGRVIKDAKSERLMVQSTGA